MTKYLFLAAAALAVLCAGAVSLLIHEIKKRRQEAAKYTAELAAANARQAKLQENADALSATLNANQQTQEEITHVVEKITDAASAAVDGDAAAHLAGAGASFVSELPVRGSSDAGSDGAHHA